MTGRTLVAGVGNIFQRDDAFGVEVIRLLESRPTPSGGGTDRRQPNCSMPAMLNRAADWCA